MGEAAGLEAAEGVLDGGILGPSKAQKAWLSVLLSLSMLSMLSLAPLINTDHLAQIRQSQAKELWKKFRANRMSLAMVPGDRLRPHFLHGRGCGIPAGRDNNKGRCW